MFVYKQTFIYVNCFLFIGNKKIKKKVKKKIAKKVKCVHDWIKIEGNAFLTINNGIVFANYECQKCDEEDYYMVGEILNPDGEWLKNAIKNYF